jgi:hypothetical protein
MSVEAAEPAHNNWSEPISPAFITNKLPPLGPSACTGFTIPQSDKTRHANIDLVKLCTTRLNPTGTEGMCVLLLMQIYLYKFTLLKNEYLFDLFC